jgi:hypothetical protein
MAAISMLKAVFSANLPESSDFDAGILMQPVV